MLGPRLLSLAIALVVALQFGPALAPFGTTAPRVSSAELRVSDDALKVGERPEPRVAPAPVLDRLPPVRTICKLDALARAVGRAAVGVTARDRRSDDERPSIVKHVPRLERGDPPRT